MDSMSSVAVPVVGMHRSGTSMVARMLEAGGVDFGPEEILAGPDSDNPHGFWEHHALRAINEELLARHGGDWRNPPCIRTADLDDPVHDDLRERARIALRALSASSPCWGWKDPRTSLLLPFWLSLLPSETRVICCVRHPAAVAASLEARNRIPTELASFLWQEYHAAVRAALPQARVLVLSYEAILRDPRPEAQRCAEYLAEADVELDVAAMVTAVDQDLDHHKGTQPGFAGWWPNGQELFEQLTACAQGTLEWAEVTAQPPPRETGFTALMAVAARLAAALDFRESAYHDRVREVREAQEARTAATSELQSAQAALEESLEQQHQQQQQLQAELEDLRTRMDNLQGRLEVRLGHALRRVFQRPRG